MDDSLADIAAEFENEFLEENSVPGDQIIEMYNSNWIYIYF